MPSTSHIGTEVCMTLHHLSRFMCAAALILLSMGSEAVAEDFHFITIDVPNAQLTWVRGINDRGQIVGTFIGANGPHGFINTDGHITTIDAPNLAGEGNFRTVGTEAMGINNAGTIVGTFDTRADAREFSYGFVEKKGQFSLFSGGCCPVPNPVSINNNGTILGNYFQVNRGNLNGFVQDVKGNRTTISVLGAFETSVSGFNARGDIVGQYRDLSGYHSFLDHAGNVTLLSVPGAQQTIAMDINDWGVIVGSFLDINNRSHGFLDIAGHFITVDVPGSQSTNITGINNLGLFIGGFIDANGRSHAFVDPPSEVPEPAPLFLLASGLVGLALLRKDFTKYARAYCDLPPI